MTVERPRSCRAVVFTHQQAIEVLVGLFSDLPSQRVGLLQVPSQRLSILLCCLDKASLVPHLLTGKTQAVISRRRQSWSRPVVASEAI